MNTETKIMICVAWILLGLFLASRTKHMDDESFIDSAIESDVGAIFGVALFVLFAPAVATYRMLMGLISKH